QGGAPWNPIPP
uniref:Bradykinin-potentiating peptide 11b n=1 Tax=Crotalus viridis viridis TaxID=8742 RepID=BP11B_CROVV|nr:RecName: Full=Bradykinin-potentiating peptide 11b; Short=BPP-11b [Crotalus viridis viridis]